MIWRGFLIIMCLVLVSCDNESEPTIVDKNSTIKFAIDASIEEEQDGSRVLTYDEGNTYQIGSITVHRLLAETTKKSQVLIFDNSITPSNGKSNIIGYSELSWKFVKTSSGAIKATCYGDYKVYKAQIPSDYSSGITIDKNTEVILSKGKTYTFMGIITDNELSGNIPPEGFSFGGPYVSFDSDFNTASLENMQGEIPYTFNFQVIPEKDNYVKYLTGRINIGTIVVRVEIDNQSNKTLTKDDIRFDFVGLTSRIRYSFVNISNMRPVFSIKTPYTADKSLTPNSMKLPISSLAPGKKGIFFFPITLSNGDANNTYLTKVSITVDTPNTELSVVNQKNNQQFKYELNDVNTIKTSWTNSGKKIKVIKLKVFSLLPPGGL